MNQLITKVIGWAEDRNLILGSSPQKQAEKTAEEFCELNRALGKYEAIMHVANKLPVEEALSIVKDDISDAIGDMTVTMIILSAQLGLDFEDCLANAYEVIKDRKGKMINGKFVKEEDLS